METKFITDTALQQEYSTWLTTACANFDTPIMGTLTFAYPVSVFSAQKQVRSFHKKLSKLTFKSAYNKYKKLIRFIPFIEGIDDERRHIHFVADAHHITPSRFIGCINSSWHGGISDIGILDQSLLENWISYISKLRTKPEYEDSLILSCTKI